VKPSLKDEEKYMPSKEVTESNTRHRVYGRGKGFPRMFNGRPCVLDAIRIILAGGFSKAENISAELKRLGWIPSSVSGNYTCNILSASAKKGLIKRERVGYYRLKPGDVKPVNWISKNKPESLDKDSAIVVAKSLAVRRHRSPPPIRIEGNNGQSQSARRLRGKLDFCWPGTERALFTVKFEIYPSNQAL
jgi:hypothetical protein